MVGSKMSGHWTDERLIAHLYGVEDGDAHLAGCEACRARLSEMQARRECAAVEDVSPEYLAAQRRQIYAALSRGESFWSRFGVRRWAPAGAAALALAGSLFFYSEQHRAQERQNAISDAQLAQEVSQMAEAPEASSTAPLKALFVE